MLRSLGLRRRLFILSVLVSAGFAAIVLLTRLGGAENERLMSSIERGYFPAVLASRDLEQALKDIRTGLEEAVGAFDERMLAQIDTQRDSFRSAVAAARGNDAVDPALLGQIDRAFESYYAMARSTTARVLDGHLGDDVLASQQRGAAAYAEVATLLSRLDASSRDGMESAFAAARANDHRSMKIFGVIMLVGLVCTVAMAVLFRIVADAVSRPLGRAVELAGRLAEGDLTQRLAAPSGDEVGQMGRALNLAIERISGMVETIERTAGRLGEDVHRLGEVSRSMAGTASRTAEQAASANRFAVTVEQSLTSAAVGVDEMTSSIGEIARNATTAATDARAAVDDASAINSAVTRLAERSREIDEVVRLIQAIAQQTNLLALNATIEAARAGEVGRGFAVVAGEVKSLAAQTTRATAEVGDRVSGIQGEITTVVEAITRVAAMIGRISEAQTAIAAAVEQESGVAHDVGINVNRAVKTGVDIAAAVGGVAESARHASEGAERTRAAAEDLDRLAGDLQRLIAGFRH